MQGVIKKRYLDKIQLKLRFEADGGEEA